MSQYERLLKYEAKKPEISNKSQSLVLSLYAQLLPFYNVYVRHFSFKGQVKCGKKEKRYRNEFL